MPLPSLPCTTCHGPVSPLSAQVKDGGKVWHLYCYLAPIKEEALKDGRLAVLNEQREAVERRANEAKEKLRVEWERLPRCNRCGRKMSGNTTMHAEFGEVVLTSPGAIGICAPCVRNEVDARLRAKGASVPEVKPAPTCVRCKKQFIPRTEHPNTCDACWNSNAPTQAVADAAKPIEKLDETLKRFSLIDMD